MKTSSILTNNIFCILTKEIFVWSKSIYGRRDLTLFVQQNNKKVMFGFVKLYMLH